MKAMNVLLRADAGETQGTGHVMRCMTLAETLSARGHRVTLMGDLGSLPWLTDAVADSGVTHLRCQANHLDIENIVGSGFDWVVVDSYSIPSDQVSQLNRRTRCLAIVDGNVRGIAADLYLDQNLGSSLEGNEELGERLLAGSRFALIRDAVLEQRRPSESEGQGGRLRVVAFMGGTDPDGAIVEVAKAIAAQQLEIDLDLVAVAAWAAGTQAAVSGLSHVRLIKPTKKLPEILGRADIVVSASGTSAWDICSMGRAAVLIALVDNQKDSLAAIKQVGVALAIDATNEGVGAISQSGRLVASLVSDPELRRTLVQRCLDIFDGLGKVRVVETMERIHQS